MTLGGVGAAGRARRVRLGTCSGCQAILAGAGSLLVRPNDGAVEEDHAELEATLLLYQPVQALPHRKLGPADESLRRHPPRPQLGGERAPRGAVLMPPHDSLDRPAELSDRARRPGSDLVQQGLERVPLLVRQHLYRHVVPDLVAGNTWERPS